MAKRKPECRIRSYGLYDHWDSDARELPRFVRAVREIPAEIDIEFGLIVNLVGAKNRELDFCIDHPGIRDDRGAARPPFEGTVYVKTNDWDFYLGDTIWAPIDDKLGTWRMTLAMDGKTIAEKTFQVVRPD